MVYQALLIPVERGETLLLYTWSVTIHNDPHTPFESEDLERIIIQNEIRRSLKKRLNIYGIDRCFLLPDLKSLALPIKWFRSKNY